MVRIKANNISSMLPPSYYYPIDWPYEVFYVDNDKQVRQVEQLGVIHIPYFELFTQGSTVEETREQTHQKALSFIADVCLTTQMPNGRITMPILTDWVAEGPNNALVGILRLGLLLTRDHNPGEVFSNPSWVPARITDIGNFEGVQ